MFYKKELFGIWEMQQMRKMLFKMLCFPLASTGNSLEGKRNFQPG
jgi:hypothetical protein